MLRIKRIYDEPAKSDGMRVLVDRLWPRGVSKQRAALDLWLKEIAPSSALRQWFGHEPQKFEAFRKKYMAELAQNPAVAQLQALAAKNPRLTLLYAAKDPVINHAVVLQKFLEKQ
ncbi:MAG TPA: DUF488 domain-containing protein [Candidatus Saccharimonadales bacterium]|nr:DUF488 domain-containing protein [Candidatus Saccharimonadales bacterium]